MFFFIHLKKIPSKFASTMKVIGNFSGAFSDVRSLLLDIEKHYQIQVHRLECREKKKNVGNHVKKIISTN